MDKETIKEPRFFNVKGIKETLFLIQRSTLCKKNHNPFAYRKTDGDDAKSLKAVAKNQSGNLLSISYDGYTKMATVVIDWSLYKMSHESETLIVNVTGNHDVDIEFTCKICFPKITPSVEMQSKCARAVWGNDNVCNIVFEGKDSGHESWKYNCKVKVFIEKVGDLYLQNLKLTQYSGKDGYMVYLNQWEKKTVGIKCDYGKKHLNNTGIIKIPISFIYYAEMSSHEGNVRPALHDEFVISFGPLAPIIVHEVKCLKTEYLLGTNDTKLFEVKLSKHDVHAQDFDSLNLTTNNPAIDLLRCDAGKYLISLKKEFYKDIPNSDVPIELLATSKNADTVKINITLTSGSVNGNYIVRLVKKNLLIVDNTSDVKPGSDICLYKGNSASSFILKLRNNSFKELQCDGIDLTNVVAEIRTAGAACFKDGKAIAKISSIRNGDVYSMELIINPDTKTPSSETVTIDVKADYSKLLSIPVKVETREKSLPSIKFSFTQDKDVFCAESGQFKSITYQNEKIGTLEVNSVANGDLTKFLVYDLERYPVLINSESKCRIVSNVTAFSGVNDKILFDVLFSGSADENESFVIKSGQYSSRIDIKVEPLLYNLPQIKFLPKSKDSIYLYENIERLSVGNLVLTPIDGKPRKDVEFELLLPDFFCFENGKQTLYRNSFSIDDENELSVFLIADVFSADFLSNKCNIKSSKNIDLKVRIDSPILVKELDTEWAIQVNPIIAKAKPNAEIRYQIEPKGDDPANVLYTDSWRTDIKNQVCLLKLENLTSIHYSPVDGVENDYVEFSDFKINNNSFLTFDNPGVVRIENGQESVMLPIYLDCVRWDKRTEAFNFSVTFTIKTGGKESIAMEPLRDGFKLSEVRNDNIYSLDLGTTGIVMAKQEKYVISAVKLQDDGEKSDFHIEKDENIISSITIIYDDFMNNDDECYQILVSPRNVDYKSKASSVFVPAKFIVGQKRIPFIEQYNEKTAFVVFDPRLTSVSSEIDDEYVFTLDDKCSEEKYLTPEIYLKSVYENILNRLGDEKDNIKRLILTYPNTYTQNVLDILRELVNENIEGLSGYIDMVPESDAVVAYYINERFNNLNDEKNGISEGTENVLIYDMGAGTLDLSLVSITREHNSNQVSAIIKKKIGIPIAGNYLDWVLYNGFFKDKVKKDDPSSPGKYLKNLKDYIKSIKPKYTSTKMEEYLPIKGANDCLMDNFLESSAEKEGGVGIKYSELDEAINDYLKLCSETILELFLGSNLKIDKLVYSGRGSQFAPLRKKVEGKLVGMTVDKTIETSDLKTCVAKGAIYYNELFGSEGDHKIMNRNQHLNLGVVYVAPSSGGGINQVYYKEIIHPDDNRWESDAEYCDGTWWREFDKTVTVDLSVPRKNVYFIQTLLSEDKIKELYKKVYMELNYKRTDINWVFVNEIYKFNTSHLTQKDKSNIEIGVKIDKENNISFNVGGHFPQGEKLVDRIEDNVFYQRGMWPYVNFNQ